MILLNFWKGWICREVIVLLFNNQIMKKIIYLVFFIFSLGILGWCSIDFNDEKDNKIAELEEKIKKYDLKEKELIFEKKQECNDIVSKIILPKKDYQWKSLGIIESFYSYKDNNCYYTVWHYWDTVKTSLYNGFWNWSTQTPIVHCDKNLRYDKNEYISKSWEKECIEFDLKLKELKWE